MAENNSPQKHQFELSGGYLSKRDQINHRIANLSVFGPVVVAGGVVVLAFELFSGRPGIGILILIVGGGMIFYARLLREVLRRWPS